jgi:ABC-type multidrug transport system fused ATPase/permease subunit
MDAEKLKLIKERANKAKEKMGEFYNKGKEEYINKAKNANLSTIFTTVLFINLILSVMVLALNAYLNTRPLGTLEILCATLGILMALYLFFDTIGNCSDMDRLGWNQVPFIFSSIGLLIVSLLPLINGDVEWNYGKLINGVIITVIILDTMFVISVNMIKTG